MKVRDLLKEGEDKLKAAGIENAAYDARVLLQEAYGMDTAEFLAELDRNLCPGSTGGTEPADITGCPGDCGAKLTFQTSINMRARHVPLQHITGHTGFMGLDFKVNRNVLIPRQDTETLVETVLGLEKDKRIRLLDLCTGSGCIAVSLKKLGGYEYVAASDTDKDALNVALRNASILGAEVKLYHSDLFEAIEESFDVIVSNPPYIETAVIEQLSPEVREFDPHIALDGGEDGLDFYRRIIHDAAETDILADGGRLYFEIGFDQAEKVKELLTEHGFAEIGEVKDLAGLDRVVYGKKGLSARD